MRISDGSSDVCSADLTLQVRFAGIYTNDGRYVRNRVRNTNEPERTVYGGRIVALWEPLENLSATLIYQHDKYEERGQTQHLIKDGTGIGTNVSIEALAASIGQRSEERRDGKECVRTCRPRGSRINKKKKK